MANYINIETKNTITESEIRAENPNVSYPQPFPIPEGYAVLFDAPQPTYDKYSETVQQGEPVLTSKGHWEQTWNIIPLEGDAITAAQAQKVEDRKAKIKADIYKLEVEITPRRTREAILGIDTAWLTEQNAAIAILRQQLNEV
jgi:hypothetical protein